jgi:hypothetical protein
MEQDEVFIYSVSLVCIFSWCDIFPHPVHRSHAKAVVDALRGFSLSCRAFPYDGVSQRLARSGQWEAAARLQLDGVRQWAESLIRAGSAITIFQREYPQRLRARLGPAAPPVLWRSGALPQREMVTFLGVEASCAALPEVLRETIDAIAAAQICLLSGYSLDVVGGADSRRSPENPEVEARRQGKGWSGERHCLDAGGEVVRVLSPSSSGITGQAARQDRLFEVSLVPPETSANDTHAVRSSLLQDTTRLLLGLADTILITGRLESFFQRRLVIEALRRHETAVYVSPDAVQSEGAHFLGYGAKIFKSPADLLTLPPTGRPLSIPKSSPTAYRTVRESRLGYRRTCEPAR